MPELPDVVIYLERLRALVLGERIEQIRVHNPFIVRSYDPPLQALAGERLVGLERIGKRLVFELEREHFLVIHLMIAGRLHWKEPRAPIPRRYGHLAIDFAKGSLLLTEAGTKKRASLHAVRGKAALHGFDRGGIEPLTASFSEFFARLTAENRTVKRALVDPTLFSGIGNAYSDEILHRARLSPTQRTRQLPEAEALRLHQAVRDVLETWIERLREATGDRFPEKVTAFREGMAVHGRYGKPCPVCSTPVQRITYATNECNYCPTCQTDGKLLRDRALSRLLRDDWPRDLNELEELKRR